MNIRDEKQLACMESHITLAKISMLEFNPIEGHFDFEHYKAIHKYLFEDLYEWAGTIRTVNLSKKGTSFVKCEDIQHIAEACFNRLRNADFFRGLDKKRFVENIVDFYCVTNNLHPFREGNGRTQRVFLSQLANFAGYELNFSDIDTDRLMIATIHASNGIDSYLKSVFEEITVPKE